MARFKTKMSEPDAHGCIQFLGHISKHTGYGSFGWRERLGEPCSQNIGAHVASYRLFNGRVPKGMIVMHSCDNRACVNPKHLELGTQKANMEHCVEVRRIARGESQHSAIMTEKKVRRLRSLYKNGWKQVDLSKRFGISQGTVSQIVRRVTWRHVD